MAYSGVYVFGDSLVDAGNALKLADWYSDLTFSDLPEGAPTAELGYHDGRFTDGFTFADLISNKSIGLVTKPVFPFGYEDPWIGIPISPLSGDPSGNNLNFAYGGAQIRHGEEVVQDLDSQTDTFKNAVDNRAPSGALYVVTMGGNDVRSLAPAGSDPTDPLVAEAALRACAQQLIGELTQLISIGARNFLITGIPDVGLIPKYDDEPGQPGYGALEGEEIARSDAATRYSQYLDQLIQTQVVPALVNALVARGVPRATAEDMINYVQIMDHADASGSVTSSGALSAILPTLEWLHNLPAGELSTSLLQHPEVVFFDRVHPTAQTHALVASYMHAQLTNSGWVEVRPYLGADVDYSAAATIGARGEVDQLQIAMVAGSTYTFQMLGVSTLTPYVLQQLGNLPLPDGLILADPSLRLLSGSNLVRSDDDSGLGLDSSLSYVVTSGGTYTLQMFAVGAVTGSYAVTISVAGAAMGNNTIYTVTSASTLVVEAVGGGVGDTINAGVSYALTPGSEIEVLQTTSAAAKTAINLTGNDFGQAIIGNNGANILEGKGGADTLTGGGGKDVFVLSPTALLGSAHVDSITDYAKGEIVNVSQVLNVAAGTNVAASGYLRVTSAGEIQVDLDGSANSAHNWVTLATVNGNSAVTFRYLSGGSLTTVTLNRVSTTTSATLMGAAVAAGLGSTPLAAEPAGASDTRTFESAVARDEGLLRELTVGGEELSSLRFQIESREPFQPAEQGGASRAAEAEMSAGQPIAAAEAAAAPLAKLAAGTDVPAPSEAAAFVAEAVAMPSAAMLREAAAPGESRPTAEVARALADALDAGNSAADLDALLDTLPAVAEAYEARSGSLAGLDFEPAAFAVMRAMVSAEMFAVQPDSPAIL